MAKKKLKKLLKGLGVGAALLGAGKALMNRRDKANQMKEFLATEGGDLSDMSNLVNEFGVKPQKMNARNLGIDLSEYDRSQPFGFGLMAKKGGRIVKGKKAAVRTKGFAKKKKQANRSKKK